MKNKPTNTIHWDTTARYRLLLKINNAIVTQTTRESLFRTLSQELSKYIPFNRFSINLYDAKTQSLSYFATAKGIDPQGISCTSNRSLKQGTIANMVIESGKPVIIDNLTRYASFYSVSIMLQAGLRACMAFPLVMRDRILGSIHFSFKKMPEYSDQTIDILTDISKQVVIAVDNMLSYTRLQDQNEDLKEENRLLSAGSDERYKEDIFSFASPSMIETIRQIKLVATTDASVLLTGETGTGKDYLAHYIHNLSLKKNGMFIHINCPALSDTLFESELFGHARGAFTGADAKRIGRFELADGGTVFLDEIGDLPAGNQAKLLHVLQNRSFERVGDSRSIQVNFRVITATNHDLEHAIKEGRFRQDLLYRLNTVTFEIPPLRRRVEDIPLLLDRIVQVEAKRMNRPAPVFTPSSIKILCEHDWPGNIRELKNLIQRLFILKPGEKISKTDFEQLLNASSKQKAGKIATMKNMERNHIEQVLIKCNGILGGKNGAARLLGMPRSTLQYRLKKYNIKAGEYSK